MNDKNIMESHMGTTAIKISARDVQVYYGDNHAIKDVSIDIEDKTVTAFIGPSGCGKSTFLRCLNRMNDTIDICKVTGSIRIDDEDIYDRRVDPVQLRAKVGMVFQKPNPFPKSIYDNVAYGPRIHGLAQNKADLDDIVERALRRGAIWNEVKDRLQSPGTGLSGGQQQRLCIARAVATEPEVLLMDEPAAGLINAEIDEIDQILRRLSKEMNISVVIVEHRMELLDSIADRVMVMDAGQVIAQGEMDDVIKSPAVRAAYFETT